MTATFAIDTFTLTSSNGANGSITPSSTVNYGTDTTFFVTPDINYDVVDVLVDGVSVGAVTSYDFTNVTASHTISTTFAIGEPLENGVSILGIGGDEGSVRIFKVTLPAGQTLLTVETTAGFSGDCDLYIRRGEMPTLSDYDAKSATEGNAELITIHDPESGNWYVMLNAYKDFSGVTLVVTYTADAPAKVLSLDATQGAYADKISLTWAGVSGATKYEVWRSDVNNVELAVNIAAVEAPAVSYEDMLPAKSSFKCYYWVRALNASYTGGFSDYAYGTTIADNSVVDLRNGVAKTGISGSIGSMRTFRLNVPAGQAVLDITVSGGTGDCDINVGLGETGSRRYSIRSTTSENIQYANPVDGNYYINIYGKTAYTDVKLMAKYMLGSPVAPTRLAATQGTFSDRIVLTWTASCGATSYDVYRALKVGTAVPKFADAVKIATVAGTEYEDTDVVFGAGDATNIYYYWLKAVNSAGSSKETAAVKGHIMPLPLAAGTLAASDGTYFDKVRVTWGRKTNVTSYEVYRTEGPLFAGETLVGGVDASSLASYVFDDFNVPLNTLPATKYYYWIKAINSDNDKSVLSIRPNSGYVSNRGPSKVIATKGTLADGKIIVTWTAVSGATSYDVYKDSEAPENVPSATYEDMPGDTNSHTFAIKAIYGGYESAFSPVASGYAGDAPSTLGAPVLKSASTNLYEYVLITWGAVAKAKAYRIYRSGTNVFPNDGGIADVIDSLTYEDHVGAGVKYYYWVTAVIDTVESKPSASKTGMAAAVLADSFADPADYPDGQMIAVAGADKGSCTYYSIVVPAGTTRLVATLSGAATAGDDCDMYAKLGCYPTTASYNAKGVENRTDGTDEILAVKNPAAGTWYFMLYGAGISGYTGRDLTVACYSAANIYLTVVPANDMNPPFRATFKGVVVDASGKGIPGLAIMARSPITGLSSYLIKTNASGVFTYSDLISTEGEHTYDFFFTDMPDTGTASHTVFTKNTSLKTADFDFSAYLKAAPVALTGAPDDLAGMKAFLNTSNGWDDAAVSATYTRMWIDETIGKVQSDDALLGKLDGGLYMVFYGVEGAGAGNGTDAVSGVPVSGLSPVPFVVHVTTSKKDTVLGNLLDMGIIDASTKAGIDLGRTGVIAIASLDSADANKDISLRAYEQLNLLSSITDKDMSVVFVEDGKYSDVLTRKFTVTIGDRQINVITSAFAAITQEE
ncbi:MAG TPA: hypothetical protein DET40_00935 [Lentisphaeria bacterium]|nr:hypothetical protein [Lentisphaeria bacterium]